MLIQIRKVVLRLKLSPIKKTRVYKTIIEQIKESIKRGELKPGDKLPSERELAERLSVSRSAVREAFSALESSGVVDTLPGTGIFLKKDSNEELIHAIDGILQNKGNDLDIVELLEVRQGIEVQAAYLAALRRTDQDLKRIKKAYENLEKAAKSGKVAAEEDLEFHISVVKASHNQMLLQIIKLFLNKFYHSIEKFRIEDMKIPDQQKISLDIEHLNIYQAIEEKDTEKAQNAMWKHYENVKLSYLTQIKPNMESMKNNNISK